MADTQVRLEIAFEGGHALGVLVPADAAEGLEKALSSDGQGIFELQADDGHYLIPLRTVVYVKRYSRETPIGFGGTR